MEKHFRHLTERDIATLAFVARYRIGTASLFLDSVFENRCSVANVNRVVRRLEQRGLLRNHSVDTDLRFCVLTRRGFEALDLTPRTPRELTEQSLPVVLAIAAYCVRFELQRLTNQEFRESYPELWRPGLRSSNYVLVETSEGVKLEMLLVDRGGAARRIRSRVRRVLNQRESLPAFVSLIRSGRFRICVLTGNEIQKRKIDRQVEGQPFYPVEVNSVVISELSEMLLFKR
ncbi:MAG: hypothetical protein AAF497_04410 [Planctomycetota bacterium]